MDKQKLLKAKELEGAIGNLKSHIEEFQRAKDKKGYTKSLKFTNYDEVVFRDKYLIINIDDFVQLYINKAKEDLAELEKQFAEL